MGYDVSAIPRLFLPSSLRGESATDQNRTPHDSDTGGKSKRKAALEKAALEKTESPPWGTKNPNTVQAWRLPTGKTFTDFFDTTVPSKRANTTDWPKLPHHKTPSKLKSLCLKYQSKGSCSALCYPSHMDPAKMESATKNTTDDHFKAIYAT